MQKGRFVTACIALVCMATAARGAEYSLTVGDQQFLKNLAKRDKFIARLGEADKELELLHRFLSKAVSGPETIILKWNQGLIKGWRQANQNLVKISKQVTCADITLRYAETGNIFYDELYSARGCNE